MPLIVIVILGMFWGALVWPSMPALGLRQIDPNFPLIPYDVLQIDWHHAYAYAIIVGLWLSVVYGVEWLRDKMKID